MVIRYEQSVATLGAVVMPHNLYLHSSLVLSRRVPIERHQEVHAARSTRHAARGGVSYG